MSYFATPTITDGRELTITDHDIMKIIMKAVCNEHRISESFLRVKRRFRNMVLPRQQYVYLSYGYTKQTHAQISEQFDTDHTLSVYCIKTVINDMKTDRHYQNVIGRLKEIIEADILNEYGHMPEFKINRHPILKSK